MLFEIKEGEELVKREMKPGEAVHITPKTVHRMTAIDDCDIFEVSLPSCTTSSARGSLRTELLNEELCRPHGDGQFCNHSLAGTWQPLRRCDALKTFDAGILRIQNGATFVAQQFMAS